MSPRRPQYDYRPAAIDSEPVISIVTPCYDVGDWFEETVRCVRQQSFQQYEWILIDDGSTREESISALRAAAERDSRVRIITQENAGPGAARNRGAREARGRFLFWLDSDDLIEPSYLEKALWCLESHQQFSFCNAWVVGFGTQEYLWPRGCERGRTILQENPVDNKALVRREVHERMGGYDASIRIGHEDWDYWLSMAAHGFWGWTIPEFLIWYRRRDRSRISETEGDQDRKSAFLRLIRQKHAALYEDESRFPHPPDPDDMAPGQVTLDIPWSNPLANPEARPRLLLIVPWLIMGGADKFNLDMLEQLRERGWQITIATTLPADHVWLSEFTACTTDVFCLDKFLKLVDYPRFLLYLMRSRGITHVMVTNSQLGYELLPMLRAHYPQAAYVDYCHSHTPAWKNGGYPAMAARWTDCLDLHSASSHQLRGWIAGKGVDPQRIETCYTNIDPQEWDPDKYDRPALRHELLGKDRPPDRAIILFVGRFVEDKRPRFLMEILRRLRDAGVDFLALLAGDGEDRPFAETYIQQHRLHRHVRLLGALPNARIPPTLVASDIFLLPSQVEGVSLAIFEAMAMGVVPVSADVGGQAELVTPEVGYLIPHDKREVELEAYVTVLSRLVRDVEHRRRLSVAARRRIVADFNLDKMGQKMHELLLRAAELHREHPRATLPPATAAEFAAMSIDRFRLERLADQLWYSLSRRGPEQENDGRSVHRGESALLLARAELVYIENSRSWRAIQRLKHTWLYRGFAYLVHGKECDRNLIYPDPRDQLAAIKRSRFYRLLQACKRTAVYRFYASRKYGPDFANPWG